MTGITYLPLHYGKTPRWLFEHMKKLAKNIVDIIVYEYNSKELIYRLSNPYFFQAFACTIGFDWHSSGTTTVTCGVLKEVLNSHEHGIVVCGGKGRASRKTLEEIEVQANEMNLSSRKIKKIKTASKISAKVDNVALQDGFDLYHHNIFFTENGEWCVIQQGMDIISGIARRYQWFNTLNFVVNPHEAICCDVKQEKVLNLTSEKSEETRKLCVELINENPLRLKKYFAKSKSLYKFTNCMKFLNMPRNFPWNIIKEAYEYNPKNFEELLSISGVGKSTIRALALISQLIYGTEISWKDPVKYSFAHGGKDGVPYPVNTKLMNENSKFLKHALESSELGNKEKLNALRRLCRIFGSQTKNKSN